MRASSSVWIVSALISCDGGPAPAPAPPKTASAPAVGEPAKAEASLPKVEPEAPEPKPSVDPRLAEHPPPDGVILPEVGILREVRPKAPHTAYDWLAVYDVDAAEPRVAAMIAAGDAKDPGDAGAVLFEAQVRDAGRDVSGMSPGFWYSIDDGARTVHVRSDDGYQRDDPNGFTLIVGPAGG